MYVEENDTLQDLVPFLILQASNIITTVLEFFISLFLQNFFAFDIALQFTRLHLVAAF